MRAGIGIGKGTPSMDKFSSIVNRVQHMEAAFLLCGLRPRSNGTSSVVDGVTHAQEGVQSKKLKTV